MLDFETDFEDYVESDFEYDAEAWDEALPRGKFPSRPGVKLPPRGNVIPRRVGPGYASKADLDAVAKRLDDKVHANGTAIKTLETRSRGVEREVGTIANALKKEIALRKKENAELKSRADQAAQIAMILPLLGGGTDSFSRLLPSMLYGGMFGGSGGLGGSSGDSNNSMLSTMMMVIALQPPQAGGK